MTSVPNKVENTTGAETPAKGEERRSYYYDDAHGYETFDPSEDESEESKNSQPVEKCED